MPELCGIISSGKLTPDQLNAWANMRNALSQSNKSHTESDEQAWAAISVVAHHTNDSSVLIHQKGKGSIFAFIGSDQPKSKITNSFDDLTKPNANSDQFFVDFEPPFTVCILNTKSRILKLISDQYGLLPLYYTVQGNALVFCTKLAPLLKSGVVKWRLNSEALMDLFTFEHVTGDHTLADTVHLLSPATILEFQNTNVVTQSYNYEIAPKTDYRTISLDNAADMIFKHLSNSVAAAMNNRSRVAITLSGGLDSRAVLGCALKYKPDLQTYTFGQSDSNDIRYAKKLSAICNVKHISVNIDGNYLQRWLDHGIFVTSGMVNCIHYHILQLADRLAAEADVVLDGFGGDALTGGHLKSRMIKADSKEIAVDAIYRQRATGWATIVARRRLFEPDFLRTTNYNPKNAIRNHFEKLINRPIWYGCHLFDLLERQRRFIQFGPHQLRSFLDVRTPIFSVNLVEFLKSLEVPHLIGQRAYRYMHNKHLPELAKVPDSARGLPLSWPESIRFTKHVYDFIHRRLPIPMQCILPGVKAPTNYAKWFRTGLRSFIEDRLLDSNPIYEGIIKKKTVECIVRQHMSGETNHAIIIGCLLTFSQWYRSIKMDIKSRK
jgi:asparagine synthase (glutamine-hydrolysing)